MTTTESFLYHYGVKGMKWGQSKATSTRSNDPASDDASRVRSIHTRVSKNKSLKSLSNKELQDAITRMNLEQQYSRMTNGLEKTSRQKASAFVTNMLGTAGKQAAQQFVNTQVKEQVQAAAGRAKGGS